MFFKGTGASVWGLWAFPLPCDRVESINPQNANSALVPKHIKYNLFKGNSPINRPNKTPSTQSCCWGRAGGPFPRSQTPGSPRFQGSPGVHSPTYVIQSYSVFCVGSQDRYYKAGIKLRVNRWRRLVQRVNFWPQFFLFCSYLPLICPSPVRYLALSKRNIIYFEQCVSLLTSRLSFPQIS